MTLPICQRFSNLLLQKSHKTSWERKGGAADCGIAKSDVNAQESEPRWVGAELAWTVCVPGTRYSDYIHLPNLPVAKVDPYGHDPDIFPHEFTL